MLQIRNQNSALEARDLYVESREFGFGVLKKMSCKEMQVELRFEREITKAIFSGGWVDKGRVHFSQKHPPHNITKQCQDISPQKKRDGIELIFFSECG